MNCQKVKLAVIQTLEEVDDLSRMSLDKVARSIGMGSRNLVAKLERAEVNYTYLLDCERASRLSRLMEQYPKALVAAQAREAGFSNYAGFRAFRRRMGL